MVTHGQEGKDEVVSMTVGLEHFQRNGFWVMDQARYLLSIKLDTNRPTTTHMTVSNKNEGLVKNPVSDVCP